MSQGAALYDFNITNITNITNIMVLLLINLSQGAALYDLLGREVELREKRQTVLARTLEIQEVVLLGDAVADYEDVELVMVMMMMEMLTTMAMVLLMVMMITKRRLKPDYATLPNMSRRRPPRCYNSCTMSQIYV